MVFDTVMGVGKTPQITQDISLNPYNAYFDDVAGLIGLDLSLGANTTIQGNIFNFLNPNVSYWDIAATTVTNFVHAVAGTDTTIFTLNLGKELIIRNIGLYIFCNGTNTTALQISRDGRTWETLQTFASGGGVYTQATYTDKIFKFLRFSIALNGSASTEIKHLEMRIDSKQLFFKN